MKVVDESLWQERCAQLEETEEGQDFRRFLVDWVDEAEYLIDDHDPVVPAPALQRALAVVEARHGTRVSTHMLGQMLCVIVMHWEHAEELMEGLSPIEVRLIEDSLALKLADLEDQAQETVDD